MKKNSKKIFLSLLLVLFIGGICLTPQALAEASGGNVLQIVHVEDSEQQIRLDIPQFYGLQNTKLQQLLNEKIQNTIVSLKNTEDSSLYGQAENYFYTDRLLVLHFWGSSYTPRAAHPNTLDCGIVVDLTDGHIYELKDLFKDHIDGRAMILRLCKENDSKYRRAAESGFNDWTYPAFAAAAQDGLSFLPGEKSLRVYVIPSHATGAISGYEIPYTDLLPSINTEGNLWKGLQSHQKQHGDINLYRDR